jgi:predicted ATPase/DNA-binding XRE family transcriptional regulator
VYADRKESALEEAYSFGALIKQRRKRLDLTRAELALRLSCATVTLQKIEQDERRPSKQMAERLAEVLGVLPAERPAFLRSARGESAVDRLAKDAFSDQQLTTLRAAEPRIRHNLPAQLTSFIGREREISEVLALLRREDVRLLTLTGPGGTGKTRLGLQVAAQLRDAYTGGVWFVDLASIREPAAVPSAIATVLGIREVAGQPILESLLAYLAAKELLLVLDNFEQVLAAVPLAVDLLKAASGVKLLVTSRTVLGAYGEQVVPVPMLGLPDSPHGSIDGIRLEQVAQTEAVALFLARARSANPAFVLTATNAPEIVEICQRLDGLPLAIELAAARSRLLTPQAVLQRLGDRLTLLTGGPRTLPVRQQALRNTLEWSHDLLMLREQSLFRQLGVFAGGCTVKAVEAICVSDDPGTVDVFDILASLGDKSLLRIEPALDGEPRFSMLETIREYALEQLVASGQEAWLRERHARYYLGWLESKQAQYRSGIGESMRFRGRPRQQDEGASRAREELSNLTATMEWITEHGDLRLAMRWWDATALFDPVAHLGWDAFASWERWRQDLIDNRDQIPIQMQAKAFIRLGQFAYWAGDQPQAVTLLEEGLLLARTLDDDRYIEPAIEWLGHAYREQDRFAEAALLYEEYMARAQARDELFDIASAHHCLGELALLQEDYPRAFEHAQASLPGFRELDVDWGIACGSINKGFAALHLGKVEIAARCFPEALRVARLYDGGSHIRGALAGFAAMAVCEGELHARRAARLLGATTTGSMVYAHRRACERLIATTPIQSDETAWETAYAEGRRMTLEQAIAFALNVPGARA